MTIFLASQEAMAIIRAFVGASMVDIYIYICIYVCMYVCMYVHADILLVAHAIPRCVSHRVHAPLSVFWLKKHTLDKCWDQ